MPGVFRPYTFVDILGTLNNGLQQQSQGANTITGTGVIGEVDENNTMSEKAITGTVTTNQGWDATVWGTVAWS